MEKLAGLQAYHENYEINNKMINALFLAYDLRLGLTMHFLDWLKAIEKVQEPGIKVLALTLERAQYPGLQSELDKLNLNITRIKDNNELEGLEILKNADIVHCQGIRQARLVLAERKRLGQDFKIVVTMNFFKNSYWYRPLFTNLASAVCLNQVDMLHFISYASLKEFLSMNIAFDRGIPTLAFPLGCRKTTDKYELADKDLDFSDKLSRSKKNIIYLADLIPHKNHLWLIKTLKDVLIEEKATLWLFGEGELKETITGFINKNGLQESVSLPGRVDGKYIPALLERMDFAVCASKSETMGHLIMEPMFAGLPVITLDVGIAGTIVRDFVTGFIIEKHSSPEVFSSAVKRLLKDKALAKKMGENAQAFARKWLTWELTARSTLEMYSSLTS